MKHKHELTTNMKSQQCSVKKPVDDRSYCRRCSENHRQWRRRLVQSKRRAEARYREAHRTNRA